MAEAVLASVVESVTGHLLSLVSQEIGLARGVSAELVKLQTTVSIIGGVLREADRRPVEAEDTKEWLKNLKELFYDADDLLDDFSTEVLRRRRVTGGVERIFNEVSIFFSSSNQFLYPREVADRVKEIRERIDAIWNIRSSRFQLEGNNNLMGSSVENRARPETIPFKSDPLFPQDYVLEPRELVYLWMAQGFINKPRGSGKTLEEVGYDYFKELLSRSFFQDIKEDLYGDIMSCRMHDLMHDLARLIAGDNCITIDSSREGKFQGGARHVTTDDLNVFNGFEGERRIRSLFLIPKKWIDTAVLDVSCFRSLRALRIRWAKITEISRSIGKLKHLRSLDLSGNDGLRCLPDSISMLCNLENLNLTECWDLEGLPSGITKLVNLRQLSVSGCENLTHMPRGMGTLTNLQKLDVFVVGEESNQNAAGLNELSRLIGLKKELTIRRLERVGSSSISSEVDASFSMEKLADLQCLVLSCSVHHRDTSNDEEVLERLRPHPYLKGLRIKAYWGARLPSWISQLHRLVQIEIAALPLRAILRHLPTLETLAIANCTKLDLSTENGDDDDGGGNAEGMTDLLQLQGHHKLRHLSILGVHKTECLPGWFQYFSNLQILTITDCKGLKSLLPGRLILPLLTSLDSLVLSYCPELDLSIGESEDMPMAAYSQFTKLRELEFYEIEKMETLPWWIQHLTNLESLVIISCENLKALPEWFPNLTSLEHLAICSCGEELTRRCQGKNGGGEDWPKISHIPHVEVER
ncbi:hypothetical protein CRG98_016757 [Punica granatum]|uniref:Uncharacterized protein n=1 Tax=Punica granatum TaxID=22663 RepID=A0A2I0K524_PUNGR|nr:hypothetical protein CRG98_016757 [Punica granatum]